MQRKSVYATIAVVIASLVIHAIELSCWSAEPKTAVDFVRDIRPILASKCFECHGSKKQEGGLRLDVKSSALDGGDSGLVIVAGDAGESELLKRVRSDDPDTLMPPDDGRLTDKQIALIERWIKDGADWPDDGKTVRVSSDHWSFQPIQRPNVPNVKDRQLARNAIDAFVQARLSKADLAPSPITDRHTLLRRLYLDLIGLPPSPKEIEKYSRADNVDWYERTVTDLLKSPHFGERWAMDWLDLARYADSDGYEKDLPRPNAYRWRDWLIEAINRDLPFDQFTVQQLAGDLLPGATEQVRLATGFHRNTLTNREGGIDQEEYRVKAVVDRVNTTFTVWMGLTIGCAECHSHKYDPITQREFYGLFAFFNNADEQDMSVAPSAAALAAYEKSIAEHDKQMSALQTQLDAARPDLMKRFSDWEQQQQTSKVKWTELERVTHKSLAGTNLTPQDDGSFLASGENPKSETYTIVACTKLEKLSAIRIEAISDKRLPSGGPGRASDGRFTLSHIAVSAEPAAKSEPSGPLLLAGGREVEGSADSRPNASLLDGPDGWSAGPSKAISASVFETSGKLNTEGWVGNSIRDGGQDGATAMLNVYHQSPILGAGTVDRFKFWCEAQRGANCGLYLLRRESGGSYRIVYKHEFAADGSQGAIEVKLPKAWLAQRGDLLAHSGNGGPSYNTGVKTQDQLYYPLKSFPKQGESVVLKKYPAFAQKRDYALQAHFTPAVQSVKFVKPAWGRGGATLTITLSHQKPNQSLGRFRITVTDSDDPLGLKNDKSIPGDVLAILKISADKRNEKQSQRLLDYYLSIDAETSKTKKQIEELKKKAPKKPTAIAHVINHRGTPRKTHIHVRGNFLDRGAEVKTQTPSFLPKLKTRGSLPDRLDMARWIANSENPLTARAAVNNIWSHLFGRGLVKTTEDFGTQGEPPSHPELLDWLATEFIRLGWSRKELIKLIVMSHTYRQTSATSEQHAERDPENLLLGRQNRFRLEGELIRDQYLATAGLLNRQIGGRSFCPPLPAGTGQIQFVNKWTADTGDELYRRGMYIHLQRNLLLPMLMTFDRPNAIVTCTRRERSNTPLQSLTLLNGPIFVESAKTLGRRLATHPSKEFNQRIRQAYLLIVAREPNAYEQSRVRRLFEQLTAIYNDDPDAAKDLVGEKLPEGASLNETAAWFAVARTLLNLDEVVTRE